MQKKRKKKKKPEQAIIEEDSDIAVDEPVLENDFGEKNDIQLYSGVYSRPNDFYAYFYSTIITFFITFLRRNRQLSVWRQRQRSESLTIRRSLHLRQKQ